MEAQKLAIPKINTELSYSDFLQMRADAYNKTSGELTGYDCEICRNKGYIAKVTDGYEVLAECRCLKIRETLRRIKSSGLEELLRQCTFRNYECTESWQTALKEAVMKFSEQESGSLYVGGQSGCGKTHLCTAAVGQFIKKGYSARYFVWRDDSPRMKALVNDPLYEKEISSYKSSDVLYIDDIFKCKDNDTDKITDADIKLAFELIDYRDRNKKLTIISTEFSPGELIKADEALGGRIAAMTRDNRLYIAKDPKKNYRLRR